MEDKIKAIMREALDWDEDTEITDDTRMSEEESWDSLAQMSIIIHLKEQFQVSFSFDEILRMDSYGNIKQIVKQKCEGE